MYTVLLILTTGIITGFIIRKKEKIAKYLEYLVYGSIYLLLFFLGASVGGDEILMKNIGNLGMQGFFITIASVMGSVFLSLITSTLFFKKK